MLARLPTRETYLMGNDSSSVMSLMLLGSRISFSPVLHLPFLYSSLVSLCRMDVLSSSCFPCFSFDYHRPASHSFMPWCSNCGETLDAVHCLYAVERKKPSYLQAIILLCSCSHQRGRPFYGRSPPISSATSGRLSLLPAALPILPLLVSALVLFYSTTFIRLFSFHVPLFVLLFL